MLIGMLGCMLIHSLGFMLRDSLRLSLGQYDPESIGLSSISSLPWNEILNQAQIGGLIPALILPLILLRALVRIVRHIPPGV